MAAKRRLLLLIVEGPSDADLLVPVFSALLRGRRIHGCEVHCDVLTAPNHKDEFLRRNGFPPSDDPRENVRQLVQYYLRDNDHSWAVVAGIVQVIDLDGAYIPDDLVEEDPHIPHTIYTDHGIIAKDRPSLIADHRTKASGTLTLLSHPGFRKTIGGKPRMIPYRLFYVSRNLEHAFRDWSANLSDDEKKSNSKDLGREFADDPALFEAMLTELWHKHGEPGSWRESWDYAMAGTHSLERGSNLRFVIPFVQSWNS